MVFDYVADDDTGVAALAHERQRTAAQRAATRYLAAVRYGNRRPNLADDGTPFDPATLDDWLFSLVFDYGDVPTVESTDADGRRFSPIAGADRVAGHVADARRSVLHVARGLRGAHVAPVPAGADVPPRPRPARARDTLVRSLRLTYDERPALTRLVAATELGHVARPTPRSPTGTSPRRCPPSS